MMWILISGVVAVLVLVSLCLTRWRYVLWVEKEERQWTCTLVYHRPPLPPSFVSVYRMLPEASKSLDLVTLARMNSNPQIPPRFRIEVREGVSPVKP